MKKMIILLTLSALLTGINTPERPFVEVIDASITDGKGNAVDQNGYYIKYDSRKFKKGDSARTILVYNPFSSYIDDVIYRLDVEVK